MQCLDIENLQKTGVDFKTRIKFAWNFILFSFHVLQPSLAWGRTNIFFSLVKKKIRKKKDGRKNRSNVDFPRLSRKKKESHVDGILSFECHQTGWTVLVRRLLDRVYEQEESDSIKKSTWKESVWTQIQIHASTIPPKWVQDKWTLGKPRSPVHGTPMYPFFSLEYPLSYTLLFSYV